ncbi:hypothetical protein SNEBB_010074 [Seison nebaliae]|nr:hypothetical protein SNEBB_010074 [Seison nebaliae]
MEITGHGPEYHYYVTVNEDETFNVDSIDEIGESENIRAIVDCWETLSINTPQIQLVSCSANVTTDPTIKLLAIIVPGTNVSWIEAKGNDTNYSEDPPTIIPPTEHYFHPLFKDRTSFKEVIFEMYDGPSLLVRMRFEGQSKPSLLRWYDSRKLLEKEIYAPIRESVKEQTLDFKDKSIKIVGDMEISYSLKCFNEIFEFFIIYDKCVNPNFPSICENKTIPVIIYQLSETESPENAHEATHVIIRGVFVV